MAGEVKAPGPPPLLPSASVLSLSDPSGAPQPSVVFRLSQTWKECHELGCMRKVDLAPSANKISRETLHRSTLKCSPLPLVTRVPQERSGEPVHLGSVPKKLNAQHPLVPLSPPRKDFPTRFRHLHWLSFMIPVIWVYISSTFPLGSPHWSPVTPLWPRSHFFPP